MVTVNSLIKKIKDSFSLLSFSNAATALSLPKINETELYINEEGFLTTLNTTGNISTYLTDISPLSGEIKGTLTNTIINNISNVGNKFIQIPSENFIGRFSVDTGDVELIDKNSLLNILTLIVEDNLPTYFIENQYNLYPNNLCIQWASINKDYILKPKGVGALTLQSADGTLVNGNLRGQNAIDFQRYRVASPQVAGGNKSFIGNGNSNSAGNELSFIGNGVNNIATGIQSSVLNGRFNLNSGHNSTIIGGRENVLSSNNSAILGGAGGNTFNRENVLVFSAGSENVVGDAQYVHALYRNVTLDSTPLILTSDSANTATINNIYILEPYQTSNITINIIGKSKTGENKVAYKIDAVVSRVLYANSTNIDWVLETPQYNTVGFTAVDISLITNTTLGGVAVQVTGLLNTEILWVASLESIETIHGVGANNILSIEADLLGTGNTSFDGNPNTNDDSLNIPDTVYPDSDILGNPGVTVPGTTRVVGLALIYSFYTGELDIYGNYITSKEVIFNGALTAEDPASIEARQEAVALPDTGCIEVVVQEPTYVKRCAWYNTTEQPHDPFSGSQLTNPCPEGTFYSGYLEYPTGEYKVMCCAHDEVGPIPAEIDSTLTCADVIPPMG
jgi:hypothetical protein